jgi:hypothetical protein
MGETNLCDDANAVFEGRKRKGKATETNEKDVNG